ncbi:MAG: ATP-binding protein, partial [Bacteriovorax sp.]
GVPDAISDKIFLPFFTSKALGKGTGLGLSISKGIIESHRGKLELVKNTKNTQFKITLLKNLASELGRAA